MFLSDFYVFCVPTCQPEFCCSRGLSVVVVVVLCVVVLCVVVRGCCSGLLFGVVFICGVLSGLGIACNSLRNYS